MAAGSANLRGDRSRPVAAHRPVLKTVRTPLNRLLGKGAVAADRDGRRYLYSLTLTREQWQSQESRSLLDRVFGGRLSPLLVHFSAHEKLGAKDIAELRKLLDAIGKKER